MGVRIIGDDETAVMYCSTTDWAFGPVFTEKGVFSAPERIEAFLRYLGKSRDPRSMSDSELESEYSKWQVQEKTEVEEEE
jgi:hypothetical protein